MRETEILELLAKPWQETARLARACTIAAPGSHVFARGLIEFSNICWRNCHYCGLRAQNSALRRYRLSRERVLEAARSAADCGVDTIVLQSGEGACSAQWLAELVRAIAAETNLPVTLAVGERPARDYELWREAGASRYLLRHETADSALYGRLHPGHSLHERLDCLKVLRQLGYEIGGGFIIGLPGQDHASIARDILLCRDLRLDMCGVGPFIAQKHTPLAACPSGASELALRVIAVLRLALPAANLPATTALATLDRAMGQTNGLLAGANVLMPVFTPAEEAGSYAIYDSKNRVSAANAARAIEAAGRVHSLRA